MRAKRAHMAASLSVLHNKDIEIQGKYLADTQPFRSIKRGTNAH
jgi:hypothetical protein